MTQRIATISDIGALIDLRIAYLTEDHGSLSAETEAKVRRQLPDYFRRHLGKDLRAFIAEENGEAVSHHISLFDDLSIQSSDFELSDDQKAQLKDIYKGMFETLRGQAGSVSAPDPTNSGGAACENIGNGC